MGQYYTPVLSTAERREDFVSGICGWAYSHRYDNGLKLMEHSWVGNDFVDVVVREMLDEPGKRLVWAGDYADPEPDGETLYGLTDKVHYAPLELTTMYAEVLTTRWLLNLDKHVYVDLNAVPQTRWGAIHPLPLLTSEGNGRGGGDFRGEGVDDEDGAAEVGSWARDRIQVLRPTEVWHSAGWTEVNPDFTKD